MALARDLKLLILGPATGPGQLGMLLAREANRIHCEGELNLSIQSIGSSKAPDWSDDHYTLAADELDMAASKAHIVTYETESIPQVFREKFADKLIPAAKCLEIFRDRACEKKLFTDLGFQTAKYTLISSTQDILESKISYPARLKTCQLGYDGLGQVKIEADSEKQLENLEKAWFKLESSSCILEEEVQIFRELSLVSTRSLSGECLHFPISENVHLKSVLFRSSKADLSTELEAKLKQISESIMEELNYIGTFCLEFFQLEHADGPVLINEAAPRVHNSGHYTLEFCPQENQFSAHIKAICNIPLREASSDFSFFSMTNLLGISFEKYHELTEDLDHLAKSGFNQGVQPKIYWYNKDKEKPFRKMGHITLVSRSQSCIDDFNEFLDSKIKPII